MRIYELAKELGIENKVVIAKAQSLGLEKSSHSNSLNADEENMIRRSFLRADDDVSGSASAPKKDLIVRRKGNVIRRRGGTVVSGGKAEAETEQPAEEQVAASEEVSSPAETPSEQVAAETVAEAAPQEETKAEEVAEAQTEEKTAEVSETRKPKSGPKVLGKIKLDQKTIGRNRRDPKEEKKEKKLFKFKNTGAMSLDDDQDEGNGKKRAKKRSRVVEFSQRDLVNYKAKRRKNYRDADAEDDRPKAASTIARKAEKMVIKMTSETITVGDIAAQMSMKSGDVIAKLMGLGVMVTINQPIDQDTATILADEFGFKLEFTGYDESDLIKIEGIDDPEAMKPRHPVVTVMGHVDHGKTSLLDYIRESTVVSKEHGGITQHIGAYVVKNSKGEKITFIDTPGHAAFTEMRSRGANLTDIVILVVAADDGVMPQTVEALNHAKAADVPIIVAVNKMDKEDAQPDRVKTQLAERGLQPDDWGGDTIFAPVSALTGQGIEDLLDNITLVTEISELKANPDCRVKGTVIEARQEQGRGTVATVLVQAGTLKVGDIFLVGAGYGRVRSMMDHKMKKVKEAGPSTPVEITGFNTPPKAGDDFIQMELEATAKEVAMHRQATELDLKNLELAGGPISLEEFAKQAGADKVEELRVLVKADVHGSLEAVKKSVEDLATDEVSVKILHSAVGGVTESDVQLANASNAIIVGFNVRGEPRAMQDAESKGIEVRFYRVIYELIDDIKSAMGGLLSPEQKEENLARVEVRDTFSIPKAGTIAGCYVLDGKVERGASVRLLRDSVVVYEGRMSTLRRFKDDVKEVQSGYECGMAIEGYNDIKVGDIIEVYKTTEVARTL